MLLLLLFLLLLLVVLLLLLLLKLMLLWLLLPPVSVTRWKKYSAGNLGHISAGTGEKALVSGESTGEQ